MNVPNPNVAEPAVQSSAVINRCRPGPVSTMRCLLVTRQPLHAKLLKSTASDEGWSVSVCAAVDEALRLAFRVEFHLAFVDWQSVADDPLKLEFEQLTADLAQNHAPLLVVSGDPTDPLAEIAARQLGVWVYMPGFDGQTELDVLFRDAREATEKLNSKKRAGECNVIRARLPTW